MKLVADLKVSQATQQRNSTDLQQLVIDCAAHLLVQTQKIKISRRRAQAGGRLLELRRRREQKWDEMLVAQGADLKAFNRKLAVDSTAPIVLELKSTKAGYVSKCDARIIGEVIRDLGGGRLTKDSQINYDVGVDQIAKPGERVEKSGNPLPRSCRRISSGEDGNCLAKNGI